MRKRRIVIALGGNAIISKKDKYNYSNLVKNIKKTCKHIADLTRNNKVIITHGNGSEIGYLLLQNEIAEKKISKMPLDILNAETEGFLGYLIQEQLTNELRKRKINRKVTTIITQVEVSKNDRDFRNPTKFVGPFYTKRQAEKLSHKFTIKKDSNRGYRRVVPSPKPKKIIEKNIIQKLLNSGYIVVASGGGGIPVISNKGKLIGIDGVIDKDLSSSLLGREIKADLLLILTDVDKVYLNYGKKNQKALRKLSVDDAKKYLREGQFPSGSMGPKIEATINFLKSSGKEVIITSIENTEKALQGKTGTLIKK